MKTRLIVVLKLVCSGLLGPELATSDNPPATHVRSCGAGKFEAVTEQSLDFVGIGFWMLAANSFARDFAGHFVQIKRDGQPLLSTHAPIALDLFLQCRCRHHTCSAEKVANLRLRVILTN